MLYRNETVPVQYLLVPIGLKFLVTEVSGAGSAADAKIFFSAGPYLGYAFKGTYTSTPTSGKQPIKFGSGANAQMDATDYGLFLNTEVNLSNVFGFGLSIQHGLQEHDLSKLGLAASTAKETSKRLLQVTVNYYMGRKNKKK